MAFKPFVRMQDQVAVAKSESDTALFYALMHFGELVLKTAVAGVVAAIDEDRMRHRYQKLYRLVRADGIGEWFEVVNDALTGPPSAHLLPEAREEQKELTQRFDKGADAWQYEATDTLYGCLFAIDRSATRLQTKLDGRTWFDVFVRLRNKTRGHGVPTGDYCARVCSGLERSVTLVADNFLLFKRPWAYLYRNLSGKYRVTPLSTDASPFDPMKSPNKANIPNGVYVHFGKPARVELAVSNVDATDFYLANGAFNEKRFELISYITGNTTEAEATPYLVPATELPPSETQGVGTLEA